eukprot:30967-Pyramimonas_sp.AAC.1
MATLGISKERAGKISSAIAPRLGSTVLSQSCSEFLLAERGAGAPATSSVWPRLVPAAPGRRA